MGGRVALAAAVALALAACCAADFVHICCVLEEPYTILPGGATLADGESVTFTSEEYSAQVQGFDHDYVTRMMATDQLKDHTWNVTIFPSYSKIAYLTRIEECDVGVSPFTSTVFREQCGNSTCPDLVGTDYTRAQCCLDFAPPYLTTAISLMVVEKKVNAAGLLADLVFGPGILNALMVTTALILVAGHIIWLLERKHNRMFEEGYTQGITSGIWWAAVTITTVGYGDKVPRTLAGKMFAFLFMFIGIIVSGILVGIIASALTAESVEVADQYSLDSLGGKTMCTITPYQYALQPFGIESVAENTNTVVVCVERLRNGEVDGVFYDKPALERVIATTDDGFAIAGSIVPIQLGPLLPEGSDLSGTLTTALTELYNDYEWLNDVHLRWFGRNLGKSSDAEASVTDSYNWPMIGLALGFAGALGGAWLAKMVKCKDGKLKPVPVFSLHEEEKKKGDSVPEVVEELKTQLDWIVKQLSLQEESSELSKP